MVGAYVFTAPVDHYIGSNLEYIFLNVMRRATDRDFTTAIIQPPYQTMGMGYFVRIICNGILTFCIKFFSNK